MGGTHRGTRVTQREAAERLGVSVEAVRKRVKRGTLRSDKGEDGRRYVYLPDAPDARRGQAEEQGTSEAAEDRTAELIATLREQLQAERQAHAEARRIIAGLVERIPAIEAPQEPPGSPERAADDAESGSVPETPERPTERPWWRRVLGS